MGISKNSFGDGMDGKFYIPTELLGKSEYKKIGTSKEFI